MLVYVTTSDGMHPGSDGPEPKKVETTEELPGSFGQIMVDRAADGTVIGVEFIDAVRLTIDES